MVIAGWLQSPLAGTKKKVKNPTVRGNKRENAVIMTDVNGLLLSLFFAGANTHYIELVAEILDGLESGGLGRKLVLCLDKGYDAEWLRNYLKEQRYKRHIQSRKDESDASRNTDFKACRWVAERTHSWMNRFRRVLTRWEKKTENYEALLHFACRIIIWNKILLG